MSFRGAIRTGRWRNERSRLPKILTRAQAEARKAGADRFARNVLNDEDKISDIEAEDHFSGNGVFTPLLERCALPGRSASSAGSS